MAHEYGEPITPEVIEAAVLTTLQLRNDAPEVALDVHVDQAIHLAFCACVIDDEDVVEKGLSGTHAAMIIEVTRRNACWPVRSRNPKSRAQPQATLTG